MEQLEIFTRAKDRHGGNEITGASVASIEDGFAETTRDELYITKAVHTHEGRRMPSVMAVIVPHT